MDLAILGEKSVGMPCSEAKAQSEAERDQHILSLVSRNKQNCCIGAVKFQKHALFGFMISSLRQALTTEFLLYCGL